MGAVPKLYLVINYEGFPNRKLFNFLVDPYRYFKEFFMSCLVVDPQSGRVSIVKNTLSLYFCLHEYVYSFDCNPVSVWFGGTLPSET